MNNLQKLTDFIDQYTFSSNQGFLENHQLEVVQNYKESKKFYLKAERSQLFYDAFEPTKNRIEKFSQFHLPFDNCVFVFDKPLFINWIGEDDETKEVKKLYALMIKFMGSTKLTKEIDYEIKAYKVWLFCEVEEELATLDISFGYSENGSLGHKPVMLNFFHNPCLLRQYCMIDVDGFIKDWAKQYVDRKSGIIVCQEISNRNSLLEMLLNLVDKIHESKEIEVTKKHNRRPMEDGVILPIKPNLKTKGNLLKENYLYYLDGKHYKYRSEEIAYGTGVKHKYRYDVRRHPRIVNGKIVWISPHQRGSGKYISKIYANRKTWFVNYLWFYAEKLSQNKKIEILIVKSIYLIRKLGWRNR